MDLGEIEVLNINILNIFSFLFSILIIIVFSNERVNSIMDSNLKQILAIFIWKILFTKV